MRIASSKGRLVLAVPGGVVDIEAASGGRFSSEADAVYPRWAEFSRWATEYASRGEFSRVEQADESEFTSPVTRPPQIFAVGVNYDKHAQETGYVLPEAPLTFTKFASSITGAHSILELPSEFIDWEVELAVIIGESGRDIERRNAWRHVAGLTAAQDYSDRRMQFLLHPAQFSLAKSYAGFTPLGPWLVTPDEFADPNDLEIRCEIDGEVVQLGRTSEMNFDVAELIVRLSRICELLPGDVILTGTPDGVGAHRDPVRYLRPGEVVTTTIEGIGTLRQDCVALDVSDRASDKAGRLVRAGEGRGDDLSSRGGARGR